MREAIWLAITTRRLCCLCLVLPLEVSILQQTVLSLPGHVCKQQPCAASRRVYSAADCAVSRLVCTQQPGLSLNFSVHSSLVLPLDVSILLQTVLSLNVYIIQQSVLSLDMSVHSSLVLTLDVSILQQTVLSLNVYVLQQPVMTRDVWLFYKSLCCF